jgi:hypothetical protein
MKGLMGVDPKTNANVCLSVSHPGVLVALPPPEKAAARQRQGDAIIINASHISAQLTEAPPPSVGDADLQARYKCVILNEVR